VRFSQGALYELGSALSFFQLKNYGDEFRAAVEPSSPAASSGVDESVPYVADDIEQNTRDFILATLARELKGHGLAEFVAHLLGTMGYRTRVSAPGPDGGIDIIAHKDELGFVPPIVKIQVKSTESSVGAPVVNQIVGTLQPQDCGMVVTLGTFTAQARGAVQNRSHVRLIDGDDLIDLVLQHYDQLDARYKGLIPLRRVFVPVVVGDEE
jgi:restriction system protein